MKTLVVLFFVMLANACATIPVVVRDNSNCPGVDITEQVKMHTRAEKLLNEEAAVALRDEASICDALYVHFLSGIMPNEHISKKFTEESVLASRNPDYYSDMVGRYKGE